MAHTGFKKVQAGLYNVYVDGLLTGIIVREGLWCVDQCVNGHHQLVIAQSLYAAKALVQDFADRVSASLAEAYDN